MRILGLHFSGRRSVVMAFVLMGSLLVSCTETEEVVPETPKKTKKVVKQSPYQDVTAKPILESDRSKVSVRLHGLPWSVSPDTQQISLEMEVVPTDGVMLAAPGSAAASLLPLKVDVTHQDKASLSIGSYPSGYPKTVALHETLVPVYDKPVRIPLTVNLPPAGPEASSYYRFSCAVSYQIVSETTAPTNGAVILSFSIEVKEKPQQ